MPDPNDLLTFNHGMTMFLVGLIILCGFMYVLIKSSTEKIIAHLSQLPAAVPAPAGVSASSVPQDDDVAIAIAIAAARTR